MADQNPTDREALDPFSTTTEDRKIQGAILALLLVEHPIRLTINELALVLHGGADGERIVLLGTDVDGAKLRWTFNDIRPDSFLWRGETSPDGGTTWRTEQVMHLKRLGAAVHQDE
jgi:hypothetical protein